MTGESWSGFISAHGAAPSAVPSYFLTVSPGWLPVMKIGLVDGRDFRANDTLPGTAIVNQAFARQYFGSENPIAQSFEWVTNDSKRVRYQIVGLVADTHYRDLREAMEPIAYFPFKANYSRGTFMVRTASANPLALSSVLRQEVPRARPGFRISPIRTQTALVEQHTVRERLLATLALFFAAVALLLAGIGLYGVLDYSVLQRRREIGIRVAIGAQAGDIARRVTAEVFGMVLAGAVAGLALGLVSVRYIATLLFQVKATGTMPLAAPSLILLVATLAAAIPAVIRAIRIDPVAMLRSE
jgi:ABC-type lipoprotein release transport system permease subunit